MLGAGLYVVSDVPPASHFSFVLVVVGGVGCDLRYLVLIIKLLCFEEDKKTCFYADTQTGSVGGARAVNIRTEFQIYTLHHDQILSDCPQFS